MLRSPALAKRYLALAPAYAPEIWRNPPPLVRPQEEYDDEVAGGFLKWFPGLDVRGKDVLDVGCGFGGRPVRYAELGAASVTGIDFAEVVIPEAEEFAQTRGVAGRTAFVCGLAEDLPFPDAAFDIVTSYDVLEHVMSPSRAIEESLRVLRPGGQLLAVFPPFYHPTGAHLESWLSRMPWANVLFAPRALVDAGYEMLERRDDDYQPYPLRDGDKLWLLNGITIHGTRRILGRIGASYTLDLAPLFSPMNSRWEPWRMRYYAWVFTLLRRVPGVRELFTHRIVLAVTR